MEHLLQRKRAQLSGGQRQRVAIGRAIVRKREVFLFDEPLSNLDAALRLDMRMELSKLHQDLGATMIYVTHDQVEAMTLADKIVVLNHGIVQQLGSPLDLYHRPANLFVAGFLGSPKMNFLGVAVSAIGPEGITVASDEVAAITIPAIGKASVGDKLTLGIRPNYLAFADTRPIHGKVGLVERLGNETIVSLNLPSGRNLIAALDGDANIALGQDLALGFTPDKAVLFDAAGDAMPLLT
ncbi:MAG: transporter ATP-binding protein [Devosia sp.]|nr:transporter ATP-binding protein [Devosia sp.]